jgi:hypothetical protein
MEELRKDLQNKTLEAQQLNKLYKEIETDFSKLLKDKEKVEKQDVENTKQKYEIDLLQSKIALKEGEIKALNKTIDKYKQDQEI